MKIVRNIIDMQSLATGLRRSGKTIGFVPTMGFLHEGHLSLMRIAGAAADVLVTSIFVNPAQFGPNEDLDNYPRDFVKDEALCSGEGAEILFYPHADEIYPPGYATYVDVEKLTERMCASSRPVHFRGVATVITKLFNIVQPHVAVFGQKDYQQFRIIERLVRDLNFEIEIIGGPIVREPDGLALSSRNVYLNSEERHSAAILNKSLQLAGKLIDNGVRDTAEIKRQISELIKSVPHTAVDYIEIAHGETLQNIETIDDHAVIAIAVFVGTTRLIDNREIKLIRSEIKNKEQV